MPCGRGCCPIKTGSHGCARLSCKRPGSEVNAFPPKKINCKKMNYFRFREFPFSIQIVLKKERVGDPSHLLSKFDRNVGGTLVDAKLIFVHEIQTNNLLVVFIAVSCPIFCLENESNETPCLSRALSPFFGLPQMGARVCVARGAFYLSPPPGFLRSNWPSLSLSIQREENWPDKRLCLLRACVYVHVKRKWGIRKKKRRRSPKG